MQGRVRWTRQGEWMYQHPDQVGKAGGEEIQMRKMLLERKGRVTW